MSTPSTHSPVVPSDFPGAGHLASIAGAQAKLAVRKVGEQYTSEFTEEERAARFAMCDDLLLQLLPYCRRKQAEHPEWTSEQLLLKVAKSMRTKGWDLTDAEIHWLIRQLDRQLLGQH